MRVVVKFDNFCIWESLDLLGQIKYSVAPNSCGFPLMPMSKETYSNQIEALKMGGVIYGMSEKDFRAMNILRGD